MENKPKLAEFLSLVAAAAEGGHLTKLVLSRGENTEEEKIAGRICLFRGESILALEAAYPDGKVKHLRLALPLDTEEATALFAPFRQLNLLTSEGNAEYRRAASGKETLLAPRGLGARLAPAAIVLPQETLDRTKKHLLKGDEPFLIQLEISDKSGRIHDKKQAKFRQINRFLEHLDEILPALPPSGTLCVFDLCCGKSYLSFAVYHYLTHTLGRQVDMLCLDQKQDVMDFCEKTARALGFSGMRFIAGDVRSTPTEQPDLVMSLHACDIATDLVLGVAVRLGARAILSTPCCHRTLSRFLSAPALAFVSREPQLRVKLAEALTDGLRTLALRAAGYRVTALELTDPENTPKNTLLRAVLDTENGKERRMTEAKAEYEAALDYLLGDKKADYLAAIR